MFCRRGRPAVFGSVCCIQPRGLNNAAGKQMIPLQTQERQQGPRDGSSRALQPAAECCRVTAHIWQAGRFLQEAVVMIWWCVRVMLADINLELFKSYITAFRSLEFILTNTRSCMIYDKLHLDLEQVASLALCLQPPGETSLALLDIKFARKGEKTSHRLAKITRRSQHAAGAVVSKTGVRVFPLWHHEGLFTLFFFLWSVGLETVTQRRSNVGYWNKIWRLIQSPSLEVFSHLLITFFFSLDIIQRIKRSLHLAEPGYVNMLSPQILSTKKKSTFFPTLL